MKKNILILLDGLLTKEQRILRTYNFLKKNKNKVSILSNGKNSNFRLNQFKFGRFRKHFFNICFILIYLEIIIFKSLNILSLFYLPLKKIKKIKDKRFNLLIVEDILLLPIAFKIHDKNILFDAREYYLEQFEGELFFQVILKPIYNFILKKYLQKCKGIFTVSNEIKKLYEKKYKVKVQILYSAPYKNNIKVKYKKNNKINLIYCGIANKNRKLEILINLKKLLKNNISISVIISNNTNYANNLKKILKLNKINVLAPTKYQYLLSSLNNFDIGLICYDPKVSKNINYCMPNKLFEYMHAKIPILSTPIYSVSKFINENNCGLVSKKFSACSLAKKLNKLDYVKVNNLKKITNNISKKFTFENESRKILKYINRI